MAKKVMVAMSGGVDSSVAAAILCDNGYEVCGATLKLFSGEDDGEAHEHSCCSLRDVEDARNVSYRLGFDHHVFNYTADFKREVTDRFVDAYETGATPNPCIDCNRYIKFRKMLDWAIALENDYIATGHYAICEYDTNSGRYLLKKAKDKFKDQTYVLYSLKQDELARVLFPLGGLEKSDVRRIAEEKGLVNAEKPDSQDICFVRDGNYKAFIREYTGKDYPKGNFVDLNGNILGRHDGIINYTIGQRKGLGITFGEPKFVVKINPAANEVVLGNNSDLFSNELVASDLNWISIPTLDSEMKVTAKVRYSHKEANATISPINETEVLVHFDEAQRAITRGQAVVFYDGDIVVGGGKIVKVRL